MNITITTNLDITREDLPTLELALSRALPKIVKDACGDNRDEYRDAFENATRCLDAAGVELDYACAEARIGR